MLLLVALGIIALYAGRASLLILVPAAAFIYYEAAPMLRSKRH